MKEDRWKTARSRARELLSKKCFQDTCSYEVIHIERRSFKNLITGCFGDLTQDRHTASPRSCTTAHHTTASLAIKLQVSEDQFA